MRYTHTCTNIAAYVSAYFFSSRTVMLGTHRDAHTEIHTQRHTHRDTHTETHTQRDTHRDTHTQIHTQRHTHRDTHVVDPLQHCRIYMCVPTNTTEYIFVSTNTAEYICVYLLIL